MPATLSAATGTHGVSTPTPVTAPTQTELAQLTTFTQDSSTTGLRQEFNAALVEEGATGVTATSLEMTSAPTAHAASSEEEDSMSTTTLVAVVLGLLAGLACLAAGCFYLDPFYTRSNVNTTPGAIEMSGLHGSRGGAVNAAMPANATAAGGLPASAAE